MKSKRFKIISIILINAVAINLSAQDVPGSPNEMDNMYVPINSSVFNNETNNNTSSNKNSGSTDFKNIISFNTTMLLREIAALEYSRVLGDYLVAQVGLGECFGPDFISILGNENSDWSSSFNSVNSSANQNIVKYSDIMSSGTSFSSKSLYKSISLKYITNDDWDWAYYIELNARFYSNNFYLNNPDFVESGDVFSGTHNFTINNNVYSLIFGRQLITDGNVKLSHEFFTGFGLRVSSYNTYDITQMNNAYGNSYNTYTDAAERQKIYTPSILIGYKLGFGF